MKFALALTLIAVTAGLSACTQKPAELRSPCPDYGRYCRKVLLNVGTTSFNTKEFYHAKSR